MKKLIFILISIGLFLKLNAQTDNLNPENGIFSSYPFQDSYYSTVKKVLFDSLSVNTDLRVLVLPSFSPEYLISLDTKNYKTFLTYRIAKEQIYQFPITKNAQVKYNSYKIEFDPTLAKKIHELFFLAISKAKFERGPGGVDGTSYVYITYEFGYGLIAGQTWSPRSEKLLGLVAITDWLNDCARTGDILNKDKMLLKIEDLIAKFNTI